MNRYREGCYNTVTDHPAKIAVIMGTHVPSTQEINRGGRRIQPFKNGEQFVFFKEDKLELLQFSLACHQRYDPGVDYELIIVDNSSEDPKAIEFLDKYKRDHNTAVFSRDNTGFSFGAYEFAWLTFRDRYDYYLFHEQDIVPTQNGWLSTIVTKFFSERNVGAVGNLVQSYGADYYLSYARACLPYLNNDPNSENFKHYNFDGMFVFTSSRILNECKLKIVHKGNGRWGELVWTEDILSAGYKYISFCDPNYKYTADLDYVDFGDISATAYAPMMHGQVLYCNTEMREHFSWYNNLNRFPYVE